MRAWTDSLVHDEFNPHALRLEHAFIKQHEDMGIAYRATIITFRATKGRAIALVDSLVKRRRGVAAGNLAARLDHTVDDEVGKMAVAVNTALDAMNGTIAAVGTEEMSASIKDMVKNASQAAQVATTAVQAADTANVTVAKLDISSVRIDNIINVITSIAEQTNLLALNATIEASRAGEAAKGFAVVANEVKELAKETAKATDDIARKIEAIQVDIRGAVVAIGEIASVILEMNNISGTIASAVEEQAATTNEMGRSIPDASQSAEDIARNISGVATAVHDTSNGVRTAKVASSDLARMAVERQALVARFVVAVSPAAPALLNTPKAGVRYSLELAA